MTKISKIRKLFYFFLLLGFILQISILYKYYNINIISDKILHYRTIMTKNLGDLKFNISQIHLRVTRYTSKNIKKLSSINSSIKDIQDNLDILINSEKTKRAIINAKKRENKAILDNLLELGKELKNFKKLTNLYLENNYQNNSLEMKKYDIVCSNFLNNIMAFEEELQATSTNVLKEFNDYKNKVYIFMVILLIVITLFFYIVMRRVIKQLKKIDLQDNLIEQQSKMAAMGEMIDSIAHQWKQPIGIIKMKIMMLELDIKDNNLNNNDTQNVIDSSIKQIEHLLNTMDNFRTFFRPNVEVEHITLSEIIDTSTSLMEDDLIKNNINTKTVGDINTIVFVNQSEFKHIIINIVNNSTDAYVDNNIDIENRNITFGILDNKENIELLITDNAGGIDNNIIGKIFQANFTTKKDGKGTGIGLYMAKQIVHKNNATITAQNLNDGVMLKITIPKLDR